MASHVLGNTPLLSCAIQEQNWWYKGFTNAKAIESHTKQNLATGGLTVKYPKDE